MEPELEKALALSGDDIASTASELAATRHGAPAGELALDSSEQPRNWSTKRKFANLIPIGVFTFFTPLASSMCAPGIPMLNEEFNNSSKAYATWVLSIYVLGYASGPLVIAPLSELYGRRIMYHVFDVLFVIFMVACALSTNMGMLTGFRFLAGVAGSVPITLGAGSISDMIGPERRGLIIACWSLGPLSGPAVGPVVGGFVSYSLGWRWIYWLLAIVWGACLLVSFFLMDETYVPILLRMKAKRLRKQGVAVNDEATRADVSIRLLFWTAISRPVKILFLCPDVICLSLYSTFVYGVYYIFITTMTQTFESIYGFRGGIIGLSCIGLGIGACSGSLVFGHMSDIIVRRLAKGGERKPEYRLPPIIPGSLFTPVGLLWFGWSVEARVHWIVPIIGTVWIGVGVAACFMPSNYIIEAYPLYVASAIAANAVLRSIGGAVLPLAGPALYDDLSFGWGNTVLAFISMLVFPMTLLLYKYSGVLRAKSKFATGD